MAESDYAERLKELVNQYYQRHMEVDEYRQERRKILDQMDSEYNGKSGSRSNSPGLS